ncbi:MAG TPA: menaquinone biosynthesis protein [Bacteroidales bacterium]|nr:menaquinone biosynthesis protein [Bacteroidales bacterium]
MSNPLRIAAVSYANTFPFVFGIENSGLPGDFTLMLSPPAQCAESFAAGNADIALVPAGALPSLPEHKIITDYCLGAVKEVKTVLLLSNKKTEDIKTIGLDLESATSVRLTKVLARHYWKIAPEWQSLNVRNFKDHHATDAFVVIGDKSIEISKHFAHKRDLAAEWQKFTGLPFVFAVWVCRPGLPEDQAENFSAALRYGIEHISDVVKKYKAVVDVSFDIEVYYRDNIDYHFDKVKQESLQKFLNFVAELE